ncbi:GDSL-type esterase/lipase family protein [Novipirellula artificiosorum]|uniref:SGNH hydrolase-type esterase domain-containing protein n=1 Tax=Novipirellula artificiosorum TaxID=2528016 RepID=A0A5C6DHC4_9BACT|nr:GDSL-type esterase/lipase family protein [Novipirellula artificiosorum]TWU35101.1 hypothetical protein Poly41_42450 [Novipirellula artificiosorum]
MRPIPSLCAALLALSPCFVFSQGAAPRAIAESAADDVLAPVRAAAIARWENDIVHLEKKDETLLANENAVLFIGSSSIRRWDSLATDMAPYPTINRGYGGAKYSDIAVFADRLIQPHLYRALVIFVGNDVSGKPEDHSPQQVDAWVRHVIDVSHAHRSNAPVFLIEVTPTAKRFEAWGKIRAINQRLRDIALTTPGTYFIATAGSFLSANGLPRTELFGSDRLHLNEAGYKLWAKLIRRRLDEVLGERSPQ